MKYNWFILIFLLFACEKEGPINGDLEYLIGDYDFVFTRKYDGSYVVSQELEDKYGIRITDKNKLYFFKNGTKTGKHKIEGLNESINGAIYLMYKSGYQSSSALYFSGDTIFGPMPFIGADNYFIKKK